jgi:hypothetical protein
MDRIYENKPQQALEDVLPKERSNFPLPEPSENNFIPQEKLTFYTVKDQEGNYKIVYWQSED